MIKSFGNYRNLGIVYWNGNPGSQWEKTYNEGDYNTTAKVWVYGRKPKRQDVIDAFEELETRPHY